MCDAEGRVAEWNPCLATLTGTEADECVGKPLAARVAEEQAELVRVRIRVRVRVRVRVRP